MTPRVPAILRRYPGVDEPIPTFPFCNIVKSEEPVLDAILKRLAVLPEDPCIVKREFGVLVPIPTAPVDKPSPVP